MTAESGRRLTQEFRVGEWTIDGNALTARRAGEHKALEPRAYAVLRYLAERPGVVVSIDELIDALWRGAVVTPNAVTRIIARLRKVLEDDAKQPAYIETVARTGYRLVAPVDAAPAAKRSPRSLWLGAAGLLAAVVLGAVLLRPDAPGDASVAVLPFANLTGNPELEYLADGVAEEILTSLSRIEPLAVSAQSRSFRLRGENIDPVAAARELGVRLVTTGSLRQSGRLLRISARVVDADTGRQLWSDTFEVADDDLFAGQDRVSRAVIEALADELALAATSAAGRLEDRQPPDPAAYDLYLRGRHTWHRRGTLDLQPAIDAFAEAVRLDPDFARAWAALASAYLTYPSYSPRGYRTWSLAEDAARKALELDPNLAEPYGVLGTFSESRLEWKLANEQFLEGVTRAPGNPTLAHWRAENLSKTGHYRAARAEFRRAMDLDPTYLAARVDSAFALMTMGDYAGALDRFRDAWDRGFRSGPAWLGVFLTLVVAGEGAAANDWIDAAPLGDAEKDLLARLLATEAGAGPDPELAAAILAPGVGLDYRLRAWMAARLGRSDLAIDMLLARLAEDRIVDPRVLWAPGIDLRQHPRFAELLVALGLVDFWDAIGWGDLCRSVAGRLECSGREFWSPPARDAAG